MKVLYESPIVATPSYEPSGPYVVSIWDETFFDLLAAYETKTLAEAARVFHRFAMPPTRGRFAAVTDSHGQIVLGWTVSRFDDPSEFGGIPEALDLLEACYPEGDDTMIMYRAAARGDLQDLGWNTSS